jgi:hypothetical protein
MKKCICNRCPRRYVCFTQQRVYSDPFLQAMFESYLAMGLSVHDAVGRVNGEVWVEWHAEMRDDEKKKAHKIELDAHRKAMVAKGMRHRRHR